MIIALDYDDTYTLNPAFWREFIQNAKKHGITVYCVTWRHDGDPVDRTLSELVQVFYTDIKAKRQFMEKQNIYVDVWIDDNPFSVDNNYFR